MTIIIELPWEKNTSGTNAFVKTRNIKKIYPVSKAIARLKMIDVILVTGIFDDTLIAFEENTYVLVESSNSMEFFGAYSRAFADEEDEFPYLCLRKAFWYKSNQPRSLNNNVQKEYIYGEAQVSCTQFFLNYDEAKDFINLIAEMTEIVKNELNFNEVQQTELLEEQKFFEYSATDGYLSHAFSYSPNLFKCDALENWTVRWYEAFKSLKLTAGRIPEQATQISYRHSVLEYFDILDNI